METHQNWSISNQFLSRFIFLYLLLYIVPYGFEYIQEVNVMEFTGWENITIWFGEWFFGWEFNIQYLLKGFDSKYDFSRFTLIIFLALCITIIWMLIDSKIKFNYNSKLKTLTRTIIRYHLGLTMILYGLSKILMLQFGEMNLDQLESTVGSHNGMGFLWVFMSYSKFYTMSTGWVEAIGGLLLLFRRTTFIGNFIIFVAMVSVVLIDIGYDVRVKMFAIHLLLMSILLMSHDFKRILNFFLLNKSTAPSIEHPLFPKGIYRKIGYVLKGGLLTYFTVSCFFVFTERIQNQKENKYTTLTAYHVVETHIINGDTIPDTNGTKWKSISINGNSYNPESLKTTNMANYQELYSIMADTTQKTMQFNKPGNIGLYEFQYEALPNKGFIFKGTSSQGDSIWIQTKAKTLKDYPLTANEIKWITDLK